MRKSAFTLIELLVVITIIAILAGIALPVFKSAQERARATQDANNLKQIGTGLMIFLNDNGDVMPPSSNTAWVNINGNAGGTNDSSASPPTIISPAKVLLSPFDRRSLTTAPYPLSYGFNSNTIGKDLSNATSLSQLIMVAPSVSGTANNLVFPATVSSPVPLAPASVTTGTHNNGKRINALFGDSHVESLTFSVYKATSGAEGTARWVGGL